MTTLRSARFFNSIARKHVAVIALMFAAFGSSWWVLRSATPESELARSRAARSKVPRVEQADRTHLSNGKPSETPGVVSGGSPRPASRATQPPGNRPRTGAIP